MQEPDWWQDAIFYQIYVRSFADSDGDGVGDLDGIRERLGYLELLGVDAVWLTTLLPDADVDPGPFDRLVAEAHRVGIKVTSTWPPATTTSSARCGSGWSAAWTGSA